MAETDYDADNLLEASLNYVEFPIGERSVRTGRNFARYTYPYRSGQGVEDLGRKVYIFALTIPLFRGVSEEHYPDTYQRLIAIVEDDELRGEVEYVDPEFGPVQVKITDCDWQTVAGKRNGGVLTITLEELGFEGSLLDELTRPNLGSASRGDQLALDVDQEMAFTGEDPGFSLTESWNKFQEALDSGALAADEIAAHLDEIYLVAEKVAHFSAQDEVERFSLFNSLIDFLGSAEDTADASADKSVGVALIEVVLPDNMDMFGIAQRYLGDAGRAEEIAFANPGNPLDYARGSTIRVPQS